MKTSKILAALALALSLAGGGAALVACGGGDDAADDDTSYDARPDGPPIDAATGPDADCVTNPTTPQQILNACTDAERIEKHPTLPLQYADGGLPPLPN